MVRNSKKKKKNGISPVRLFVRESRGPSTVTLIALPTIAICAGFVSIVIVK